MPSRIRPVAGTFAVLLALAGCAQVLGLDGDPYIATPDGGEETESFDGSFGSVGLSDDSRAPFPVKGTGTDARGADVGVEADAPVPACGTPNSCGPCGHICTTTDGCNDGVCTPVLFAGGQNQAGAIAADEDGVYWLTGTAVVTCPESGCPGSGPTPLVSGLTGPMGLGLDATYVYWGSISGPATGDTGIIGQCARTGCEGAGTALIQDTFASSLAVAQGSLVWFSDGTGLEACSIEGCTPTMLIGGTSPTFAELALSPSATPPLYVTSGTTGSCVQWCSSLTSCGGGGTAACFSGAQSVSALAMDDAAVYMGADYIYSCPLGVSCLGSTAGSNLPAPTVVSTQGGASNLIARDGLLFWVSDGIVYRCSPSDCASPLPLLAAGSLQTAGGLAVTDQFVYVTDSARGLVLQVSR